jgi:putative tricarboxylic transport membrane protein
MPAGSCASGIRLVAAGALALACLTASAQGWQPTRPIEINVPTTPGGSVDLTARLVQKILQGAGLVKVPVSVINKPGGGGAVSIAYLNQHPGDAHFVAINTPNIVANEINGRGVRFSEVTPIATMASQYTVLAVRTDSPLRNGKDLIERLRKDPASLAVSTPTTLGSINHMAYALVARAGGVDVRKLKAVILGSGNDGATAVLGGHVDAHSGTTSSVIRMVEAGKLRVLGIASPRRLAAPYDTTPTWTEQGLPVVMDTWRGVIGPKGMSREQIAFWNGVLAKVVATEEWKEAVRSSSWDANYLDSEGTRKLFESDYQEYRSILGDLGLLKEAVSK